MSRVHLDAMVIEHLPELRDQQIQSRLAELCEQHDIRRLSLLPHMLDAALEARSFSSGQTQAALEQNRMLVLSLVKCIEIVGEAASRISNSTQIILKGETG